MFRKIAAVAAVGLTAVSVAACGGSSQATPRQATQKFVSDLKAQNWSSVCSDLSLSSEAEVSTAGAFLGQHGCADTFKMVIEREAGNQLSKLSGAHVTITRVVQHGATAYVYATSDLGSGGDGTPLQLVRRGGKWLVNLS